jgi:hypothetical protein
MGTFFSIMNTILTGGTWSNYGSQPQIIQRESESKRQAVNEGIALTVMRGNIDLTISGEKINNDHRGAIEVYARNTTDRNNMMSDIESILANSSYAFDIFVKWTERTARNRYAGFYEVKILD